jgi:hypothetical protein
MTFRYHRLMFTLYQATVVLVRVAIRLAYILVSPLTVNCAGF